MTTPSPQPPSAMPTESGWHPIATAPKYTLVEALDVEGSIDRVEWRGQRQCMLGSRAGECGPGWVSEIAGWLPIDPPTHWRPIGAIRPSAQPPSAVCPTCGRRPSERIGAAILVDSIEAAEGQMLVSVPRYLPSAPCPDPIHDLADSLVANRRPAAHGEGERIPFNVEHKAWCAVGEKPQAQCDCGRDEWVRRMEPVRRDGEAERVLRDAARAALADAKVIYNRDVIPHDTSESVLRIVAVLTEALRAPRSLEGTDGA